jgi:miniconductance mechanosensitive channel
MDQFLSGWVGWPRALIGVVALAALAWTADVMMRRVFLKGVRRLAARTRATWDDHVIARRVMDRVAHMAPAVLVYVGMPLAMGFPAGTAVALQVTSATPAALIVVVVRRVSLAFIVLLAAAGLGDLLAAVDDIYTESYAEARSRPIKGYLQVVAIFVYVSAGIVVVAVLADKSPILFLSGLGALTAVLLLIFRDTILSLVASIQIMSNDMIRLGDWITMPQAHADGDVVDIALHTVKIQNWDKTISTVPTHKFISESFKNWRGMSESGGRRIKRALHLDLRSVRFLTEEEITRLSRYELLKGYMGAKLEDLAEANAARRADGETIPEQRRLTNVGTFRAYVLEYLKAHRQIHDEMTLLVRQLDPGPEGLPLELYCFSRDTAWASYEAIQADIFDHLLAILPEFGLRAFQQPTGNDFATWTGR